VPPGHVPGWLRIHLGLAVGRCHGQRVLAAGVGARVSEEGERDRVVNNYWRAWDRLPRRSIEDHPRDEARRQIGNFIEIYLSIPVEECIKRDVKGLYKKALAGEIQQFTGISDPYEPPENAEIVVPTHEETIEDSVSRILRRLEEMGHL